MSQNDPASPGNLVPAHRMQRMTGRDPHEGHRAATPLELLFDLTFVIAFGLSAAQLAHLLAAGHVGAGIAGPFYDDLTPDGYSIAAGDLDFAHGMRIEDV